MPPSSASARRSNGFGAGEAGAGEVLPRLVAPIAVSGSRRPLRAGHEVFSGETRVGVVTSGSSVPTGSDDRAGRPEMLPVGLALVDSAIRHPGGEGGSPARPRRTGQRERGEDRSGAPLTGDVPRFRAVARREPATGAADRGFAQPPCAPPSTRDRTGPTSARFGVDSGFPNPENLRMANMEATPEEGEEIRPAKILVVDDEPDLEILVRQKFRRRIRRGEFEFTFAQNGLEALERLAENPELEMILSDINMPRLDGLSLLNALGDVNPEIRAVMVSAYGDMDNIRTAMNRGAFDFRDQADRLRGPRDHDRQDAPALAGDARGAVLAESAPGASPGAEHRAVHAALDSSHVIPVHATVRGPRQGDPGQGGGRRLLRHLSAGGRPARVVIADVSGRGFPPRCS